MRSGGVGYAAHIHYQFGGAENSAKPPPYYVTTIQAIKTLYYINMGYCIQFENILYPNQKNRQAPRQADTAKTSPVCFEYKWSPIQEKQEKKRKRCVVKTNKHVHVPPKNPPIRTYKFIWQKHVRQCAARNVREAQYLCDNRNECNLFVDQRRIVRCPRFFSAWQYKLRRHSMWPWFVCGFGLGKWNLKRRSRVMM